MHPRIACFVLIACFELICARAGNSAPLDFKLLSLVPPGSQVISGFENNKRVHMAGGPLLLSTHNNSLDLQDWVSIAAVDPQRMYSEILQVTFAPPDAFLREHLLLVSGKFNREDIFRSAELNGATRTTYEAETILVIEPFAREKADMADTRWLAILDDRIAVFGTRWMVEQAVSRFENRAVPDPALMKRLALFRHDVDSWNLIMSMPFSAASIFLQPLSPWSEIFDRAEYLMVSTSFDTKIRVDILLQVKDENEKIDLNQRAAQFSRAFAHEGDGEANHLPDVKNLEVNQNGVKGSIVLSNSEFISWKSGQIRRNNDSFSIAREEKNKNPDHTGTSTVLSLRDQSNH
jgi:hypothetical protein